MTVPKITTKGLEEELKGKRVIYRGRGWSPCRNAEYLFLPDRRIMQGESSPYYSINEFPAGWSDNHYWELIPIVTAAQCFEPAPDLMIAHEVLVPTTVYEKPTVKERKELTRLAAAAYLLNLLESGETVRVRNHGRYFVLSKDKESIHKYVFLKTYEKHAFCDYKEEIVKRVAEHLDICAILRMIKSLIKNRADKHSVKSQKKHKKIWLTPNVYYDHS